MLPKNRIPTHPGEVLLEEFLVPLGISQVALAEHLEISLQRINEIVRGKRGVTPETAWLFAQAFGTRRSSGSICRPIMTWQEAAPSGWFAN